MIRTLRDFLLEFSHTNDIDERREIEAEVWRQFGAERTVMVLDMSGFSLLTRKHGVVHYLSMVRRMHETVRPIVNVNGGSVVKFEADNAFTVFPTPQSGVEAAIAINRAAFDENVEYPSEFKIQLSMGIDHGRILLVEGEDFFGDAVNSASKLGEDLAEPGEVLVSRHAMDQLPSEAGIGGRPVRFSISGIELDAVSISY